MNIEAIGAANVSPHRINEPTEQVARKRQDSQQQSAPQNDKMPPEELINQIKSITEDGLYSVRFERDSGTDALIVQIVDSETDKVIRQIPPEELVNLSKHLREMSGNLVDTLS